MSNKEKFQETFGQIEASKEVLSEVESLEVNGRRKNYIRPVIVVAMACALVFITGKAALNFSQNEEPDELAKGKLYYAAEMEKEEEDDNIIFVESQKDDVWLKEEHVIVNNDELSEKVIDFYVDDKGFYCYKMENGSTNILVEKPEHSSVLLFQYRTERGGNCGLTLCFEGELKEVDGRIYLSFNPYEKARDITEDFQDGIASERMYYEYESLHDRVKVMLEYRVEGTIEDYTVDVTFIGE